MLLAHLPRHAVNHSTRSTRASFALALTLASSAILLAACQTPPTASEDAAAAPATKATTSPVILVSEGKLTPAGEAVRDQGLIYYKNRQDAATFHAWLPLAEAGHPESQFNLGVLLQNSNELPNDDRAALGWHKKAAARGYGESNCHVGNLLRKLSRDDDSLARARNAYLRGADMGESVCMHNAAAVLLAGEGGPRDAAGGAMWLAKAAEAGLVESQLKLGTAYLHGNYGLNDPVKARHWLGKAAEAGDMNAMHNLASMLDDGHGGPKDAAAAAVLYRKAAAAGQGQSANNLGLLYRQGAGVKRDDAQAIAFFTRAIELQNFDGAVNLGDMHFLGRGTKRDRAVAAVQYKRAAENGVAWGECRLAAMMRHGEGLKRDLKAANAAESKALAALPKADCRTALSKLLR